MVRVWAVVEMRERGHSDEGVFALHKYTPQKQAFFILMVVAFYVVMPYLLRPSNGTQRTI